MTPIVTVTGATGPVGTAVPAHLLQHGIRVRAVARSAAHLAPRAKAATSSSMPESAAAGRTSIEPVPS